MKSHKQLITFRYLLVGIVVVTCDYAVLNALLFLKTPLLLATTCGFLVGTITGFMLHNSFTFRSATADTGLESKKFLKFIAVALVGLLSTDFIVYFFTESLRFHHNFSKTIAVFVSVVWAYSASRWWVFASKKVGTAPAEHSLKILVFSPYYPPHIGGLESHSDEFNSYLSRAGIHITVFTPRLPKDALEGEIWHDGVKILRFPAFEPLHNYPMPKFWRTEFWQQWGLLFEEEYDIVISRTRFFFPTLMALWYAHVRGFPLLHIEHGSDFAKFNSWTKTKLGILYDCIFGRFVLRHADRIVSNSQASADFVKKLSGRTDCQVVYRGLNVALVESIKPRQDLRDRYQGKTIIVFIGRLIDGKGVRDLITAIAELKRATIICLIIGSGPEEKPLKKLVLEHRLENQILFFGNLPFHEAIGIFKTADIVVNPSYTEGLPTSVTEAALCQKAIIATDVGGTREVISGNNDSYLIEPKNIEQLKDSLSDLIDHPEKRLVFGQNAYVEVKDKFSWGASAKKYLDILDGMILKNDR